MVEEFRFKPHCSDARSDANIAKVSSLRPLTRAVDRTFDLKRLISCSVLERTGNDALFADRQLKVQRCIFDATFGLCESEDSKRHPLDVVRLDIWNTGCDRLGLLCVLRRGGDDFVAVVDVVTLVVDGVSVAVVDRLRTESSNDPTGDRTSGRPSPPIVGVRVPSPTPIWITTPIAATVMW